MTHLPRMAPDLSKPHASVYPGADDRLIIQPDPEIGVVVERFSVTPGALASFTERIMTHVTDTWMLDPGFIGMALLQDRSETSLAVYAQWHRTEARDTTASVSAGRSLRTILSACELLLSERYEVAFSTQAPDHLPPSHLSLTESPFVHFGVFRVAKHDQDELLRRAAEYGPNSFGVPGLNAINFHRGRSGRDVLNLGLWTTFEQFAQLFQQPGFNGQNEYFRDLAEFKAAFFDVIAVKAVPATGPSD